MKYFLILLLIFLNISCKKDDKDINRSLEFTVKDLKINVNENKDLTNLLKLNNLSTEDLIWSSSDNNIVSIDNGKLKAISPGKIYISVTSKSNNNLKAYLDIEVLHINVTSISIKNLPDEFIYGETYKLSYEISPSNSTNFGKDAVEWKSHNENIAKFSNSGELSVLDVGKVKIQVNIKGKNISQELDIDIKPIKPEKIEIIYNKKSEYFLGDTVHFNFKIIPSHLNRNHYKVIWSSNNFGSWYTNSWSINSSGIATANNYGNSMIKAQIEGMNISSELVLFTNYRLNSYFLEDQYKEIINEKHVRYDYYKNPINLKYSDGSEFNFYKYVTYSLSEYPNSTMHEISYKLTNNGKYTMSGTPFPRVVCEDDSNVIFYTLWLDRSAVLLPGESVNLTVVYRTLTTNKPLYIKFEAHSSETRDLTRIYFNK